MEDECNVDTDPWCNDTDKGKQKYWENILYLGHSVHHKSHTDFSAIKPRPPLRQAGEYPSNLDRLRTKWLT